MSEVIIARKEYPRAEFLTDAIVHISGLAAALLAVPFLIKLAVARGADTSVIIGASVYGASLIAMILFSALYHMVPRPHWKGFLRRLDHSAIYCKIAGTYTPVTILAGGHGSFLLTGIWGAALAGTAIRMFAPPERFRWVCFSLYLGMGWLGVVAGWAYFSQLSQPVLALLLVGGLMYTIGTLFHLWESLPFHTAIWHLFVLVATMVCYAAVVEGLLTLDTLQTSG